MHSRHLRALRQDLSCSYASRDKVRAEAFRRRFGGLKSYGSYAAALDDPAVDAVVVAVPPALPSRSDAARRSRPASTCWSRSRRFRGWRTTKPCACAPRSRGARGARRRERSLQAARGRRCGGCSPRALIGDMVFAHFTTIAQAAEDRRRLAQRRSRWPAATRSSRKASTGCTSPAASARGSRRMQGFRPSAVARTAPTGARRA